ncbi:MAG: aminotransferase class I/II-fold pyridoxal phosphate-dependent enzyme [Cyanophyceae cyanobacterium]
MPPEPIAIVGIGCRFPGADRPQAFWRLLQHGVDTITEVPQSRWDSKQFYDPDPTKPNKTNIRRGGFLQQIDQFDPQFFGIAPKEAVSMDPQQRLLLEVAWEALEDGGQVPEQLAGTQTGVFIGTGTHDYSILYSQPLCNNPYVTTGTGNCIAANRLSYVFNFKGPSLAVETACSSSLVAVHLACHSLWRGESSLALAGGVNVLLLPTTTIGFTKGGFLAPDGRCKSFDAQADGYVRSEGAGVVVLKPLAQAQADGDPTYAVIRGSAVNQDGGSNGLAAPDAQAQEAVIRAACRQAGISPGQIQYIEAHGTGTKLGDTTELQALGTVLSERLSATPCAIGSVKTNIGHLETAAGIAGLIKVALSLKYGQIPPSLHCQHPHPGLDNQPLRVQTTLTSWESTPVAGVNSFGFGGTNAHVVLSASEPPVNRQEAGERPVQLLALSARSGNALAELAQRYCQFLEDYPDVDIADVCFSANTRRSHFHHRLAVVAQSTEQLREQLRQAGQHKFQPSTSPSPIAFLFTGQGSQYPHMGHQLYQTSPLFRTTLNRCAAILEPELDRSLIDILYPQLGEARLLNQTVYTQPALFAIEYALAQLWISWGVVPTAVLGHSVGEYVAACIAGVFSLEAALRLIALRGRLMQALPQEGAMVSVAACEAEVREAIASHLDVAIAAVNGPANVVISGEREAIAAAVAKFTTNGIHTTPLNVSHAFHSPLMEPMLAEFEQVAREIDYAPPRLDIISNVTGDTIGAEIATPQYWCRHIQQTVRFADGIKTLHRSGYSLFLECGPKPLLSSMGRAVLENQQQTQQADNSEFLPSLRSDRDWQTLLSSLAQLYTHGVKINWSCFEGDSPHQFVPLPTYPFQRQRYWCDDLPKVLPERLPAAASGKHPLNSSFHPLLGQRIVLAGSAEIRFQSRLNQAHLAYLTDHRVGTKVIFPASAYVEMALAAGASVFESVQIEQLTIAEALVLTDADVNLQFVLTPQQEHYRFQIYSLVGDSAAASTLHASGVIAEQAPLERSVNLEYPSAPVSVTDYYQQLRKQGLDYGESFQAIQQLWRGESRALAQIQIPESVALAGYQLHPVLLDACFQSLGAACGDEQPGRFLPVGVERLQTSGAIADSTCFCQVQLEEFNGSARQLKANLTIFTQSGGAIAQIDGLLLQSTSHPTQRTDWLYELVWQPQPLQHQREEQRSWLIFSDRHLGVRLARLLEERGDRCVLVFASSTDTQYPHICIEPTDPDRQKLQTAIAQADCDGVIYLWSLEKTNTDAVQVCNPVLQLVQSFIQVQPTALPQLLLVTRGTQAVTSAPVRVQQSALWGLGRTINLEHPDLCRCIDLDPAADNIQELLNELAPDAEKQVAYRQGVRYVARLMPRSRTAAAALANPVQLQLSAYGVLDNLTLVPTERRSPQPGEVEIQVRAAGVNFRDVMNALGMLQDYLAEMGITEAAAVPFGGECAGTVVAVGAGVTGLEVGDEVMAAQAIGSLSSFVTVKAEFVVPKPQSLSFAAAATLPTAFLTAFYGLHYLAKIKAGDRVLIHAAAGGVGQAAVQIAQQAGAEVFATASPPKWEFLNSQGIQHVMNSRTLDFAEEVMQLTGGRGVDLVFNSLNGEFIAKNLAVLAANGRFVEIGKVGIWSDHQVKQERGDVSYFPFDLLEVSQQQPELIANLLTEVMQQFQQGHYQPLPHRVFPITEAAQAFRYMAQAKHIGKVVISFPNPQLIRKDSSYLVTGGLGALGLQVAQWLVEQGAKHLILAGRTYSASVQETIRQLESRACVTVVPADISNPDDVTRLVAMASVPLRGVIHAAGVLDDGLLMQQNRDRFERVMKPKVAGAWNLHVATQDVPLDFFVCFSSIASLLGSPGQSNYAAANAFMDALMQHRHALGSPGLSINWGPWSIGMAADKCDQERLRQQGIGKIAPQQGLPLLELLLQQQAVQVGVLPINWSTFWQQARDPFFEAVQPAPEFKPSSSQGQQQIEEASDRSSLLVHVQSQLAKVLGFSDPGLIDTQDNFADLGMDSLMAVEFKNSLQASLRCSIPQTLFFDYPTVEALTDYLRSLPDISQVAVDSGPSPRQEPQLKPALNGSKQHPAPIQLSVQQKIPEKFYRFSQMPEYLNLQQDLARVEKLGNPFFTVHEGIARDTAQISGREVINFSSYNYLGLSGDPRVTRAAQAAIERYGTSVSASRVVSGERPLHRKLEEAIAHFLDTEDCIIYIGGHATNVSTIGHLFGPNDLVLCDAISHNSIRQGCQLSGAAVMEFPHNDWQTLEAMLAQYRYQYEKVLIAIEGIYSTDGDIAPLPQFVDVKHRYKALLMVDEAHSVGVLGASGRGIGEYYGVLAAEVDLWMGTLSKSFASCGGYIAGCREVVQYLKYTAPGFVYSVGMSPANAAAALAALQLLEAEPERVTRLQERAKLFLELAKDKGFNTGTSKDSPIIPVIVGEPRKAVQLSQLLFQRGINVQPMVYPSVPYDAARLRFFVTSVHSEEQIRLTIGMLAEAIAQI